MSELLEEIELEAEDFKSSMPLKKVPYGDVFEASRAGDVERLRYLLECGVNVNARDPWDSAALYYACLAGHLDAARMLLESGAICSEHTFDGDRCHYAALNLKVRKLLKAFEARPPPLQPLQAALRDTFLACKPNRIDNLNLSTPLPGDSSDGALSSSYSPPDIVFYVEGRPIEAHRVILSARSSFFKKKFLTDWKGKKEVRLSREKLSYPSLFSLLHFFYSDRLEIAVDDMEDLVRICRVCKCHSLQGLLEKEIVHQRHADYKALREMDNSQKRFILQGLSLPDEDRLPAALSRLLQVCLAKSSGGQYQEYTVNGDVSLVDSTDVDDSEDDLADVCVRVEKKLFRCHQAILASRSEYFKARLSHMTNSLEERGQLNDGNLPCIEERDLSTYVFEKIIEYMYSDGLTGIDLDQAEEILDAASRYLLFPLKRVVADVLLPQLEMVSPAELCHWLILSDMYGVSKIREYCLDAMANNFETFADTPEFRAMLLTLPAPSGDFTLRTTAPSAPGAEANTVEGNLLDDLREKWLESEGAELDKRDESALLFDKQLEMLVLMAEHEKIDFAYIPDFEDFEPSHEEEHVAELPNQGSGNLRTSSSAGGSNILTSTTTGRAKRSKVWDHFDIEKKPGTNDSFAVCRICKSRYSYKTGGGSGGTGTLKKHLVTKHKLDPDTLQPFGREPTQQQINPSSGKAFTITKEISRKAIVKFVTKCCQPFIIAEQEGFVEFTSTIQPGFHNISRHTLKKYCFDMYKEYKETLKSHLSNISCRVSLTTDIWTNLKYESYLVVTCHWIDETWTMQKRILALDHLESSHNAYTIARYVINVVKIYGIHNKIMSITLDNASANTLAIKYIKDAIKPILDGNLLHVRCACHIINLCVKSACDEHLAIVMEKFKVCGKLLRERRHGRDWKTLVETNGIKFKKFPLPIDTRWNSLYHLLETMLRFQDLVTPYYNNIAIGSLVLTNDDWNILSKCVSLLEIFKESTEKFSGINYPTTTMFLPLLFNMIYKFIEFRDEVDMQLFVSNMESKFLKYWEKIPIVHGLATLLDPSQSQGGLDIFFEYYAKFLNENVDDQKKSIMHSLQELFELYASEQCEPSRQPEETPTEKGKGALNFFQSLKRQKFKGKSVSTTNYNEIQIYLSQYIETTENFDVLDWWKVNSQLYPVLAAIARDVLAVQSSSVASESAFSVCGRIIGDQRTNLKPETLSMLTCLQDWFAAEKKNRTAGAIDEFQSSSSEEDQEYSKYILVNRDEF